MCKDTTNSFAVLNSVDDDFLEKMAVDCDIILGGDNTESKASISAMKLEEISRATIAEAIYKQHLEIHLNDCHALNSENLDLSYISNSKTGYAVEKKVVAKSSKERSSKLSRELKRISLQ